jgi:hypothetical protein
MTGGLPEEDFDYSQPFEVDIGRAAVIAEALRVRSPPLHCQRSDRGIRGLTLCISLAGGFL